MVHWVSHQDDVAVSPAARGQTARSHAEHGSPTSLLNVPHRQLRLRPLSMSAKVLSGGTGAMPTPASSPLPPARSWAGENERR